MKLTDEQVQALRADLMLRIKEDAIQQVVDGGDLDRGKVSRLEMLVAGSIVVDHEELDALLCDGDGAERVRQHIDGQVRGMTLIWFTSERGKRWLELAVENELPEVIEDEEGKS